MKVESRLPQELKELYRTLEVIPQLVASKNTKPMKLSSHFIDLKLVEDNGSVKNKEISFDELFEEKSMSSVKSIKEQRIEHILIKGAPGSGKSVLMDKIAFEWVNGKFPQFHYLFRINFRRLQIHANGLASTPRKLMEFIQQEIINGIVEHKQDVDDDQLKSEIKDCLKKQNRSKTVILLDGFDEVASYVQTNQAEGQTLKGIAKEIESYNVVITSRPNAVESAFLKSFKRIIEIQEIQRKQMVRFIDTYFDQAGDLKIIMKKIIQSSEIYHLMNSPFLLTISCIMVAEKREHILKQSEGEIKENKLYEGIIKIISKRYLQRTKFFNQKQRCEFQSPGYDLFSEVKPLKIIKDTVAQLFYRRGQTTQISSIPKQKFDAIQEVEEFGLFKKKRTQKHKQSPRMQTPEANETLEFYHLNFGQFLIAVSVFEELKKEWEYKISKKYGSLESLLTAVRYWPSSRNILKFVTELITDFYSNTPANTKQRELSVRVLKNFWTAMLSNSQDQVEYGKQERFRLFLMLMKASRLSNNDKPEYYPPQIPCLDQIQLFMKQCIFEETKEERGYQISNWTTAFIVEAKYLSGQLTSKLVELIKNSKQDSFLFCYAQILPKLIYQKSNSFLAEKKNKNQALILYLSSRQSYMLPHRFIKLLQSLNQEQFQNGSIYIEQIFCIKQKNEQLSLLRVHLFLLNSIRKYYVDRNLKSGRKDKAIKVYETLLANIKHFQLQYESEVKLCFKLLNQLRDQLDPFDHIQEIFKLRQEALNIIRGMKKKRIFIQKQPANQLQNCLKELQAREIIGQDSKWTKLFLQRVFNYPDDEQVKKAIKKYINIFLGYKIYFFLILKILPCYQSLVEQNFKQVIEINCERFRKYTDTFSLQVFYNLFSQKGSQLYFNELLDLAKQIIKTYLGLKYLQNTQFGYNNTFYFLQIVKYFQFSFIFKYDHEINQYNNNPKENIKNYSITFNNEHFSIKKKLDDYFKLMASFRTKERNQFRKIISKNKTSYDTQAVCDLFVSNQLLKLAMFDSSYYMLLQSEKGESIWLQEKRNQFGYIKVNRLLKEYEEAFLFWHPQLQSWEGINSKKNQKPELQKKLREFKQEVLGDRNRQLEELWTVTVYQLKQPLRQYREKQSDLKWKQKYNLIKSHPEQIKKEKLILTQSTRLLVLMGYTQQSLPVIASKLKAHENILQKSGIKYQAGIKQWLQREPIQCQAYFYTLYWKITNLVCGFGIASSGTVQRKEDISLDTDQKQSLIKSISKLCIDFGEKIPLIGGAISILAGFVNDIISERDERQFENLITLFKELFQNKVMKMEQDLLIQKIAQGLVKERKKVIIGKEKDLQEKQNLLKNVTDLVDKVKQLCNSAKEAIYLQKQLTTTLESQQQTKNAVCLALMDAEILFTVLSQKKDEIIGKHLKKEQIAQELIKTYMKFKIEKEKKINQQNFSESERLQADKSEIILQSKSQKNCCHRIFQCLCFCISRKSKEEREKAKRESEKRESFRSLKIEENK